MPHQRDRQVFPLVLKRARLWPVVGIIGARQTGKSVLLRELVTPALSGNYVTLDSITQRKRAETSPEGFSEPSPQGRISIIDEIQKAPDLFDALKLHVDSSRRPGMYIVSGSTEFSQLTGIRESLTGRIGILRLYPMSLQELTRHETGNYFLSPTHQKQSLPQAKVSVRDFDRKLERGGMPGLCFIRDDQEFRASCDVWLETTCYRDLQQIRGRSLDGALALEVLAQVAQQMEPTVAQISKALRKDARLIVRYLRALEAILVIHRVRPHPAGVGKPQYLLFDPGLASHLGGNRETLLRTHLLHEALCKFEYAGHGRPDLLYYRNAKSSRIPLIFDWQGKKNTPASLAIQIHDAEAIGSRDLRGIQAFAQRLTRPMRLVVLSQAREAYVDGQVEILPLRG